MENSNLQNNISSNDIIKINDEHFIIDNIISSNQFSISNNYNKLSSNIFVYGTRIDDFNVLNKDYIYTLNVCATKKLYENMNSNVLNVKSIALSYTTSNSQNINILNSNINELNNKISYLMNVINDLKTSNNLI